MDYLMGTVIGAALGFSATGIGKMFVRLWNSFNKSQQERLFDGAADRLLPIKSPRTKSYADNVKNADTTSSPGGTRTSATARTRARTKVRRQASSKVNKE